MSSIPLGKITHLKCMYDIPSIHFETFGIFSKVSYNIPNNVTLYLDCYLFEHFYMIQGHAGASGYY